MWAAMIKAPRAGVGSDLRPVVDNYVSSTQLRLADGTLARNRSMPESPWLDDLYMSVPCLAQAGKLTGDSRYFDDAARQIPNECS
jgi:rhamnogalacturonyl hydrolase YesR